ncbi:hypothetical protein GGR50DRAFT_437417 [Xylaria sp. CBS 124048]|nr:hypothetical protein GGR50DRAFT_437417 [Xylaria sp. CBS 124048]
MNNPVSSSRINFIMKVAIPEPNPDDTYLTPLSPPLPPIMTYQQNPPRTGQTYHTRRYHTNGYCMFVSSKVFFLFWFLFCLFFRDSAVASVIRVSLLLSRNEIEKKKNPFSSLSLRCRVLQYIRIPIHPYIHPSIHVSKTYQKKGVLLPRHLTFLPLPIADVDSSEKNPHIQKSPKESKPSMQLPLIATFISSNTKILNEQPPRCVYV